MNFFSVRHRAAILHELNHCHFDLLVIGGGITGAGIALDATCRGLKVALVEMQDFASGTSGRSTKLIHGGLRYLKQGEFKLVAEVGKERAIIHHNAPHLAIPEKMLLPIARNGSLGKLSARVGMTIYEWLAGVKKAERHRFLNKAETMMQEPLLAQDEILGGIVFYEYRTDDARLTLEVMREAVNRGAMAANYCKVVSYRYDNNNGEEIISGAVIRDEISEHEFEIKASQVVNAGGPWVDELDDLDKHKMPHKLQLTKGVHLVVDHSKLPLKQAVYFDTPDHRMIFAIPRENKIYIGTTDTFYKGDIQHPVVTIDDKNYLLDCVNDFFPGCSISLQDIESSWAGLRPLISKPGKGPSEISRRDEIFISKTGLITIAGGKLTGYRKMAERVVNKVAAALGAPEKKEILTSGTHHVKLPGSQFGPLNLEEYVTSKISAGVDAGITATEAEMIIRKFGSAAEHIFKIAQRHCGDRWSQLPLYLEALVVYTMEHELCQAPEDFFARRTGMLYFNISDVTRWKKEVTDLMQRILEFDAATKENHLRKLDAVISASVNHY